MLLPKRVKHRKQHRGRMTGVATRGNKVTYGEYGLMTTEPAWITAAQIEAARIAMTRYTSNTTPWATPGMELPCLVLVGDISAPVATNSTLRSAPCSIFFKI